MAYFERTVRNSQGWFCKVVQLLGRRCRFHTVADYARTETMKTNLAKTHYPDAIVARAVVLAAEGHSIRRIESELAKKFPDQPTPSREAVRRWALTYADSCREDEGDRMQRIITLADDSLPFMGWFEFTTCATRLRVCSSPGECILASPRSYWATPR